MLVNGWFHLTLLNGPVVAASDGYLAASDGYLPDLTQRNGT